MNYTSKELSQKIKESGFIGESEKEWGFGKFTNGDSWILKNKNDDFEVVWTEYLNSYDLIYDICIKYKEEFWGEEMLDNIWSIIPGQQMPAYQLRPTIIFYLIQQNKIEKAEQYFLDNSILFK